MSKGTYKLIDGVESPQQFQVVLTRNGGAFYTSTTLTPGEVYELEGDERFLRSLYAARVHKPYSDSLKETLDQKGIAYELNRCQSCGGRITKLSYPVVEVTLDDET